ncbi:MAG: phage terminase large subunit [Bacteroides sp.]|nr:phage terminase large subunit [Bacteroides sp.]
MEILIDYRQRQKIRADFKNFLYLAFKYINLPSPTQIQYDIADVLQYGWDDTIVEGFRGVAKSTITGCYADWKFDNDPENYQLLEVSANQTEACKFLKFSRDLLNIIPFLNYLIPDKNKGQRDSALQFDVRPALPRIQPSCKALGIFGQITGNRAVEIIADDIETSQNCDTSIKREAIRKAVTEFSPVLRPLKGRILYLGTPHTETSIYNEQQAKGCKVQIFPVRYPNQTEILKYNGNLSEAISERLLSNPELEGQPTDPLRFDTETIIKEESKGRSKFLMQYMLDNTLSDIERYPLKCSDLIVMDCHKEMAPEKVAYSSNISQLLKDTSCNGIGTDCFYGPVFIPEIKWLPYHFKTMAIDPSGRGKDESAFCIIGVLNGYLYVLKWGGMQGGYCEENLKKLALMAYNYKVNKIKIEANFGDGMFTTLLTPYLRKNHPCAVEEVKHNIQKEKRIIDTLEPVMNQHRLIIDKNVIKEDKESVLIYPYEEQQQYSGFYQMTRITKDRGCLGHDDKIDVLAIGVQDCLDMLQVDADEAIKRRTDEELDREIERIYGGFFGKAQETQSWFDI